MRSGHHGASLASHHSRPGIGIVDMPLTGAWLVLGAPVRPAAAPQIERDLRQRDERGTIRDACIASGLCSAFGGRVAASWGDPVVAHCLNLVQVFAW